MHAAFACPQAPASSHRLRASQAELQAKKDELARREGRQRRQLEVKAEGEVLQLIVRGGSFKCAHLEKGAGEFVLLGEGVAPGFDFRDFAFVSALELKALLPADKYKELASFLKERPESDFDDYYDKPTTRA